MSSKLSKSFWLLAAVVIGIGSWVWWQNQIPRRESVKALHELNAALVVGDADQLTEKVLLTGAWASRTPHEQAEFLRKVMANEISGQGIEALGRNGKFGPVAEVFPEEAAKWCKGADVAATNCVAFRMERNGSVPSWCWSRMEKVTRSCAATM